MVKLLPEIICPSCGHNKCAPGHIAPSDSDSGYPSKFYPAGADGMFVRPRVKLEKGSTFYCCLECGLTWSRTDPVEISAILSKYPKLTEWVPAEPTIASFPRPDCPSCKHNFCVPGGVDAVWAAPYKSTFHPDGIRYWYGTPGTELHKSGLIYCCLKCGLVWSAVATSKVIDILAKLGVPRGEVPIKASYALHQAKWILFILTVFAIVILTESLRR